MTKQTAWTPFHAQLHRTLRERQLLQRNDRILVAVSGGQDSLCLIRLLWDLQPKWAWHLAIAHCDHQWRPDSQANAQYVEQLAKSWQVPFYLQTATDTQLITSEASARQWRYQALTDIAQANGYQSIVTGHTASDRAETLLHNLIRGSGADGLQALSWQRPLTADIQLVRPLLEITRTQTAQFCQEHQLRVWEDSTNQDTKYTRNRIRQELLPQLKAHFNPNVEQALAQTAELLRADVEYLEDCAHQLMQQALWKTENTDLKDESDCVLHPFKQGLNCLVLRQAPIALQRRVMRQFLGNVLPNAPSFEQIEKLTALITAPNRSRTDPFPGGLIAEVEDQWLWLTEFRFPIQKP